MSFAGKPTTVGGDKTSALKDIAVKAIGEAVRVVSPDMADTLATGISGKDDSVDGGYSIFSDVVATGAQGYVPDAIYTGGAEDECVYGKILAIVGLAVILIILIFVIYYVYITYFATKSGMDDLSSLVIDPYNAEKYMKGRMTQPYGGQETISTACTAAGTPTDF